MEKLKINGALTMDTDCSDIYNGSNCGDNDCGDRYCYPCNCCDSCRVFFESDGNDNLKNMSCDHIINYDQWC